MSEIIFEVREDEVDGGLTASALGVGIHTEGATIEELRVNVREAVDCYFDETMEAPRIIRLHFVRDEVLARRIYLAAGRFFFPLRGRISSSVTNSRSKMENVWSVLKATAVVPSGS